MAGTGKLIGARATNPHPAAPLRASARLAASLALPVASLALLAGCAAPPSPAEQAEQAACTQAADVQYQQDNLNGLARTGQNGLYFAPMPDHVFDSQRMGSMSARDNEISQCEQNGSAGPASGQVPAPQVIVPSQPPAQPPANGETP